MDGLPALAEILLVFARLGPLCAAGALGQFAFVTWRVQVIAGIALTLLVYPASGVTIGSDWSAGMFASVLVREALLGMALGIGFSTIGKSVELAANLMNALSGGTWGAAFSGSYEEETPLVRFLVLTTIVALLGIGGHRMILSALLDTYRWLPPGTAWHGELLIELVTTLLGQSVLFGLRAAAPVILSMLVGAVVVGVAARLAPAFGQLSLTLGLNVLLLVASLILTLGTLGRVYQRQLELVVQRISGPTDFDTHEDHVSGLTDKGQP